MQQSKQLWHHTVQQVFNNMLEVPPADIFKAIPDGGGTGGTKFLQNVSKHLLDLLVITHKTAWEYTVTRQKTFTATKISHFAKYLISRFGSFHIYFSWAVTILNYNN